MEESMLDLTELQEEIENAPEPIIGEVGEEYKLRIVAVNTGVDKNGKDYFMPVYEVPDEPMIKEFSDFFNVLDKEKLSEKEYQRTLYKTKVWAASFEIDLSRPISYADDVVGQEGWAILGARTSEDFGEQNTIRKYVAPK